MQAIQRSDGTISSMLAAAKQMARKYGQIGHLEPDDICQNSMIKLLKRTNDREPTLGWLHKTVRSAAADAVICMVPAASGLAVL